MIQKIRAKIRSLIEDSTKLDTEVFEYTNSSIFVLAEENISSIVKVEKNGSELGSGQFSYDLTTNELTIITTLIQDDKIIVKYNFNKYSDNELNNFIESALVFISINEGANKDFEIETTIDEIVPTPTNQEQDLVALIASILIKPNYSRYTMQGLTVVYPRTTDKESKINQLINKFYRGLGVFGVITF